MRTLLIVLVSLALSCAAGGATDDGDSGRPDSSVRRDTAPGDVERDPVLDSVEDEIRADAEVVESDPDADTSILSVRLEPSHIELGTSFGVPTETRVRAFVTNSEGEEAEVTTEVSWRSDSSSVLRFAVDGTATATGVRAGRINFYARLDDAEAVGTATVRISALSHDEDIVLSEIGAYERAEPGEGTPPQWLYPEHGTVYPVGIDPPVLQWTREDNTLMHLTLEVSDYVRVDHYTRTASFVFPPEIWTLLANDFDNPIQMTLDGTVSAGDPVRLGEIRDLHTADANLEGSVYYWQIRTGDIMEIPADEPVARPLFPDNAETGSCRGCHAITRDGSRIGFMYNGGGDPRAGLAWVDEPDPPIVENFTENRWDFLSFDPAGHRAAAVYLGDMWLADTTPGIPGGIANLGPIPNVNDSGRRATTPAWSPDGSTLVYAVRGAADVDWSFETGDLWSTTWDQTSDSWGTPAPMLGAPHAAVDTLSYPSWSPDSRLLAYSAGPNNRGDPPAELHMSDSTGAGSVRLFNGGPEGLDVMPAFSPFREGGYYWLLFYSQRPYGAVTENKQLWVMAIDADYSFDGTDPSHAAFWLPGQNPEEANITALWARSGCDREGNQCKTDQDCCAGLQCIRDDELGEICTRVECTLPGHACGEEEPCCAGYECATSLIGTEVCQEVFDR
ncbi:MAG: hypothetical protein ACJAYU_000416 [Bradymonadia bacterium]|jgi:hypothetical protein